MYLMDYMLQFVKSLSLLECIVKQIRMGWRAKLLFSVIHHQTYILIDCMIQGTTEFLDCKRAELLTCVGNDISDPHVDCESFNNRDGEASEPSNYPAVKNM